MNKQFLANFNWRTYISLNPDLNHVTNEADAIKHYATYGIHERRSYKYKVPADFNWETYISLNPDLNHVTSKHAALKHYSEYGINEQRRYRIPTTNNAKVIPTNNIKVIPTPDNAKVIPTPENAKVIPTPDNAKVIPTDNSKATIKLPNNTNPKIVEAPEISIVNKQTFREAPEISIVNKQTFREAPEISIVNKQTFREACLQQLPLVKNIEIPEITQNCNNETVLIEFRWFDHLEFLLRNMVLKLPKWSHTVVCGNNNYDMMKKCCHQISESIRIIKLDINNLIPSEYSVLLMSPEFWRQFNGEKILIYQEDSFLFHSHGIDTFLEYDYVGAPWKDGQDDNAYGVGNGGFSLRSKSIMLEVIDKVRPEYLIIGTSTLQYMKNANVYVLPEDVYFSKSMIDYNLGKVAPRDIALRFSQESVSGNNPLGGHNFFLADQKLDISYKMLKLTNDNDYYNTVAHRGGWKTVINFGLQSQALTKLTAL
jgi:hypothetical protein